MRKERAYEFLTKQKQELTNRIDGIEKDLRDRHLSRKSHQQNIERANDDVLGALEEEALEELKQTINALRRLEEGEYGYCRECGLAIGDERLAALPHTEYCRSCAEFAKPHHTVS